MDLFFHDKDRKLRKIQTDDNFELKFQTGIKKFIKDNAKIEVDSSVLTCFDHIPEDQPEFDPGPMLA